MKNYNQQEEINEQYQYDMLQAQWNENEYFLNK